MDAGKSTIGGHILYLTGQVRSVAIVVVSVYLEPDSPLLNRYSSIRTNVPADPSFCRHVKCSSLKPFFPGGQENIGEV